MKTKLCLLAVLTLAAGGCRDDMLCALYVTPGIDVVVRDSRTGQSIAEGAVGIAREGAYVDSLRAATVQSNTVISLAGALNRAGRYTVTVERSGYVTWTKSNVNVERGTCQVITEHLTANLIPAS